MSGDNALKIYDAAVIGAGFGGLYATHKLANEQGLSVVGFDKADGVGGTWYWNRYPGALSDTESYLYRFSFDDGLLADSFWKKNYLTQPEILSYFNEVADRFDLRRHFNFGTAVTSAIYLDDENLWKVTTDHGDTYLARYVVNAVGLLAAINFPKFDGLEDFNGTLVHTAAWPENLPLDGKRVGVIGTGSTGVQVVTAAAPVAKELTHFIRTPQYSVPLGLRDVSEAELEDTKANFRKIWDEVWESSLGFGIVETDRPMKSVTEAEREEIFEEAWQMGGGFRFMFSTFGDISTDEEANNIASEFIRAKVASIVKDPEKARKLMPSGLHARRPLSDNGFYDAFNRENVDVVALRENPIKKIVPEGVLLEDGTVIELDVLIFATGFDAVDGNYRRIDIRGRNGLHINDHWDENPDSYLGVSAANFPNWFMVLGPNGPFTNLPPSIETQVEWISDVVAYAENNDIVAIEPLQESVDKWTAECAEIANATVFAKADSWIFGANIPGKKPSVLFYLGGLNTYRKVLADIAAQGYPGFQITKANNHVNA
ncbi:MAG: NAD(P)/FAD-dependent oxidoreductase [Corynebacterium glutamicum]|nr:NAD(P)/FAD-dependent oxidoreductase [Corynebacterium glutamicum]